jgi:hypothetical protein
MSLNRQRQRGAVLGTSLILLTVMTTVGITAATLSGDREQSAASYRQQVDAMMAAEHGELVVRNIVSDWIEANNDWPDEAQARNLVNAGNWRGMGGDDGQVRQAQSFRVAEVNAAVIDGTESLVFDIEGAIRPGDETRSLRQMQLVIQRSSEAGDSISPFEGGLIGCDGLSQSGSASVDSFHSGRGAYGANLDNGSVNARTGEVRMRTINAGADGSFSGNAPVYGDVAVTGDLSMSGATPIHGNVFVDGSVNNMNGTVGGTVQVGGNISLGSASNVQGPVRAGGNVTVGSTSTPPPAISAMGSVSWPSWWISRPLLDALTGNYREQQEDLELDPVLDPSLECDPLAVVDPDTLGPGQMFWDAWNDPAMQPLTDYFIESGCAHCIDSGNRSTQLTGGRGNQDASDTVIGNDGSRTVVRVDNGLGTQGRLSSLTIRGDVTLVVDGDFDIGNNTQMRIAPDANLTVMVSGQTDLGGGSNVLTGAQNQGAPFVRNDKPAFSLYSAHRGSQYQPGVRVSGANSSHVAVYAPNTSVRIRGSGNIFGAVRAGFLDLSGSGDIHYDTMLGELSPPGGGAAASQISVQRGGWWEGAVDE